MTLLLIIKFNIRPPVTFVKSFLVMITLLGQEAQSSEINEEISKDEHVASLDLPVDENTTDPPQDPQQDDIKQIFIEHMEKETIYNTQAESYVRFCYLYY